MKYFLSSDHSSDQGSLCYLSSNISIKSITEVKAAGNASITNERPIKTNSKLNCNLSNKGANQTTSKHMSKHPRRVNNYIN